MFVVSSLVKFDKAELNSANLSLLSDVMLMEQARDGQAIIKCSLHNECIKSISTCHKEKAAFNLNDL